ncbi:MAG: hypothetical protein ACKOGL_08745, partial [Acidimicrobiaceae bacterium]
MFEYVAFNPYNASPEAMANELTKKSSEGWEVVSIVPTFDGRYCAFLRRPSNTSATTTPNQTQTGNETNSVVTSSSPSNPAVPAAW